MNKSEFVHELNENILHFWAEHMLDPNGGFYGQINGNNILNKSASRGIVMHARILWTFASAYTHFNNPRHKSIAQHAYQYIVEKFLDSLYGGVYWEVDCNGIPIQTKKQIYAQAFTLYAFSAFYKITQNVNVLEQCIRLYRLIEQYKDKKLGGYFEAFTREWNPISDMRLSDKDANEAKSMNTHLHVLEAYSAFLSVYNKPDVLQAQKELLEIFLDRIYNKAGYFNLFFDPQWNIKSSNISYGHDIEAAWLIWEAATIVNDAVLKEKVLSIINAVGDAVMKGVFEDGSLAYEMKDGVLDAERHWWVQAEAVVGYSYLAKIFDKTEYNAIAAHCWAYIKRKLVDTNSGEWYWSRLEDGQVNRVDDKAGFWKCPYHNGRMCIEMINILDSAL